LFGERAREEADANALAVSHAAHGACRIEDPESLSGAAAHEHGDWR
jgi:hypothetical protein